ncbi:alanine transaminase, partial [Oceanidesulfovibrio indonesiensis]
QRRFEVYIDPDKEAVVTMGAKEGLSHLAMAMLSPGDVVFATDPAYPIHPFASIIAGADVRRIPIGKGRDFFEDLMLATKQRWPKPKLLVICYPHNPTTEFVYLDFVQLIVDWSTAHNFWVIHALSYADLTYERYEPPSFLKADGANYLCVELFSLTKPYYIAGWSVGLCSGNREVVHALTRIKCYLEYGIFQPIQLGALV